MKASELMFYLGAGAYFTLMFLNSTMFVNILPISEHIVRNLIRFTCYGFIIAKIIMVEKYTIKRILLYAALSIPLLLCYKITGYIYQLDLFMLIAGARGINADRIIRLFFCLNLVLLAVTFIAVAGGLIENRTFIRAGSSGLRNSVGFIYPTDFGARIFYTLLAFCYLVGKRFRILMVALFGIISVALIVYCDARLDAGLIIIAGILFYMNARSKLFMRKWVETALTCCFPVLFLLSYFVTMAYPKGGIFKILDTLLSKRLMFGYYNVLYAGIHPFGVHLFQQGHGALNYSHLTGYNFVDCGFLQGLLEYGYILMFFVLVMFVLITKKAIVRGRREIAIVLFLIALSSCIDHHFLEFWYDPFPLLIFAIIPYAPEYAKKKAVEKAPHGIDGTSLDQEAEPVPKGLSHDHDVWGWQVSF
ncbi:MAG: hypothetical protein Q4A32_02185 [Lachnospiraceae bacterium]|nr:hypothetical protein [Lachnospiraceae bacterium]